MDQLNLLGDILKESKVKKGYLKDYITDKILRDTPKEKVRQVFEQILSDVYGYPKNNMDINYDIYDNNKVYKHTADIIVFKSNKRRYDTIYIVVRIDSPEIQFDPINSLLIKPNTYFIWTNGVDIKYFRLGEDLNSNLIPILDIPKYGLSENDIGHIRKKDLVPSRNLKLFFDRIHNYIFVNQGLSYDQIFSELLKIIFCKLEDEKNEKEISDFYVTLRDMDDLNTNVIKTRINKLFSKVKNKYKDVFDVNENIVLNNNILTYVVNELQKYSLLKTDIDIKGTAFQSIIGKSIKGDRGEYFTPKRVCQMMIKMLDIQSTDLVLDPACGSGGFLINTIEYMSHHLNIKLKNGIITDKQKNTIFNKFVFENIFGIDFNPLLAKTSKMNLALYGANLNNVIIQNSLLSYELYDEISKKLLSKNRYDVIITNPPMGAKCKIFDKNILKEYELGYNNNTKDENKLASSQLPEILFLERCLDMLKPNGRLGIVMTKGILSNEKDKNVIKVRNFIKNKAEIISVIDLPRETFLPHTGALTSALFLRKKETNNRNDYEIYMATPTKIGHDRRGNKIYKMDANGNFLLKNDKLILDDKLVDVANSFINWKYKKLEPKVGYIINFNEIIDRLDATYNDPQKKRIISDMIELSNKNDWKIVEINDISKNIFFPNRFKRIYVDEKNGIQFLSGSDIINYDLVKTKYISKNTKKIESLLVEKDWILVTRSGTVGIVVKVPIFLDKVAVSEHVIRIIPNKQLVDPGYLTAFLSSKIGKKLLNQGKHGSVVDELSTEYIGSLKIPLIPIDEQKKIGKLIFEADEKLSQAHYNISSARLKIEKLLQLQ